VSSYQNVVEIIKNKTAYRPKIGVVLGTGLGGIADFMKSVDIFPYDSLPGWPVSTVEGHAGRLVIGELKGKSVIVMQGRIHYYEGYSTADISFPIKVMRLLGVDLLIITNASGGLNDDFEAGDIMLIADQINYLGMSGVNPLNGTLDEKSGSRFLNMSNAFDAHMRNNCHAICKSLGIVVREGIYAGIGGPNLETPAEYKFLKIIGADAVGMSTVTEVLVARHVGMKILGMSGITNVADLSGSAETSIEEVLRVGEIIAPKMLEILLSFIKSV
tara:strand:+ start:3950 stop:4768 length:819 start_codon:yes stop_codon:yes gene_type:complete